jgi:hypothetical protein
MNAVGDVYAEANRRYGEKHAQERAAFCRGANITDHPYRRPSLIKASIAGAEYTANHDPVWRTHSWWLNGRFPREGVAE